MSARRSRWTRALALGAALVLSPVACDMTVGGEDGNFGGLDLDGDGKLTPEDVGTGEVALFVVFNGDGEQVEVAWNATDGAVTRVGAGMYSLRVSLENEATYTLTVRFEGEDPMGPGSGDVTTTSMSADGGWYAYDDAPEATMEITEFEGDRVSGTFVGQSDLDVLGEDEQPTGETVRIVAFAFHAIDYSAPE